MKKKNILKSIRNLLEIFFIGAFAGFIYEIIFYLITENRFDNPGILYGPWLPIYGTGAILIYLIAPRIKKHPIILFIGCMLVTGILEYIIGYIDLHIFNQKLWDYTGLFLNIDGFVCLRSVLTFAIGGMFLTYIIIPLLDKINDQHNKSINVIITIMTILFIADIIISNILNRTPFLY